MPERDIRKELKKRVESYGGEVRAAAWLGRRNCPDVFCLFTIASEYALMRRTRALQLHELHPVVEAKAPGGVPTSAQLREHKRMVQAGYVVLVISTFEQLDHWLPPRA